MLAPEEERSWNGLCGLNRGKPPERVVNETLNDDGVRDDGHGVFVHDDDDCGHDVLLAHNNGLNGVYANHDCAKMMGEAEVEAVSALNLQTFHSCPQCSFATLHACEESCGDARRSCELYIHARIQI